MVQIDVDTVTLQTAAGHAGEAAEAAVRARARILEAIESTASWCPVDCRSSVDTALEAMAFAALQAQVASQLTAARLVRAAENYAAADQLPM